MKKQTVIHATPWQMPMGTISFQHAQGHGHPRDVTQNLESTTARSGSSHFKIKRLDRYRALIEAAGVSPQEFIDRLRPRDLHSDEHTCSPANFAAVCDVISDICLPPQTAMASVHAHACIDRTDGICLRAGATSSLSERAYLERLANDAALALRLFDLFLGTARSLGIAVNHEEGSFCP